MGKDSPPAPPRIDTLLMMPPCPITSPNCGRAALFALVGELHSETVYCSVRLIRLMADKADPFTKVRLLKLAEGYDERFGLRSKPMHPRKEPIGSSSDKHWLTRTIRPWRRWLAAEKEIA
jgi:hypothetical protein